MVVMGTVPEVLENLPYPRSYKVHRKMCSELMRLVNEIVNIFPDIEAARPRCSSGLQALCSLNMAVEKAKLLLQYCSESSKLYLAVTGNVIVSRCRRTRNMLEQSLNEIQNMVPVMLAVRVSQIVDELRTAVFALDPSEEEAGKVVLGLLQPAAAVTGTTENCEAEVKAVQFAAFRLGITSPKEILVEKRSIKNLLNKVADSDPKKKKILKYLFHLLTRHGSLVLEKQAENAPDHPEEDQSEVVTNVGSRYGEALEVGLGVERREYEAQTAILTRATPPEEFKCPLSSRLMYDPVVIASGETFERVWIEKWFDEQNNTCPKTKEKLAHKFVTPNTAMKDMISKWCMKYGITISDPATPHCLENSSTSIVSFSSFMNDLRIPADISNMSLGSLDSSSFSVEKKSDAETILEPLSKLSEVHWDSQCKIVQDVKEYLIHNHELFDFISAEDILKPLINFLSNARDLHDSNAQKAGTQLLLEFVSRNRSQIRYLDEDVVSLLSSFLDTDAVEETLDIMVVLSEQPECRTNIAASGILLTTVNILDSHVRDSQERAIRILSNLSSVNTVCSNLVSLSCIPKLVPFLRDRGMAKDVVMIFKNLCDHQEARSVIASTTGSIASIAELLENGGSEDQESAVYVLLSLCSESVEYSRVVMGEGVIPALVDISINGTRRGMASAMELLRLLRDIDYETEEKPECFESDFIRTEEVGNDYTNEKKTSKKSSKLLRIFVSRKKK